MIKSTLKQLIYLIHKFISLLLFLIFGALVFLIPLIFGEYSVRISFYIGFTLAIIYMLVHIYLLKLYSKKIPQVPNYLPQFLKDWLSEFEVLGPSPNVQSYINMHYLHLFLYIGLLIFYVFMI